MRMTDKEVYEFYMSGVPVTIIAEKLNTSRGHIYNKMSRHKDPVRFKEKQMKYEMRKALK